MAFLCEAVTVEADGSMNIQRIIDCIRLKPSATLPIDLHFKLVIGLISGDSSSDPRLMLRSQNPNQDLSSSAFLPFDIPPYNGVPYRFSTNLLLHIETVGTYWIELLLQDKLLTRIPLMIVLEQNVSEPQIQ